MSEGYKPYRFAGGLIYLDVEESPMMRRRVEGRYEPAKVAALQRLLRPGMTFVDVGSNKGDFTLIAAQVMNDDGRVLAFEPSPENCSWIRKSIDLNGYRCIQLHELALADVEGRLPLYLGAKSGWHSLQPGDGEQAEAIEVPVRTLDSVLSDTGDLNVDVMKVDVEGAELNVLRGAKNLLASRRPVTLLVDVHPARRVDPAEVCALLVDYGFSLRDPQQPERELPTASKALRELFAVRE